MRAANVPAGVGPPSGVVLALLLLLPSTALTTGGSSYKAPPPAGFSFRPPRRGALLPSPRESEASKLHSGIPSEAGATAAVAADAGGPARLGAPVATCRPLGGDIYRIRMEGEEDASFLAAMAVPTFAAFGTPGGEVGASCIRDDGISPRRMGLEGVVPGAFVLRDALSRSDCEEIVSACEDELKFGTFRAGKNNHGAMQVIVTDDAADGIARALSRHIDVEGLRSIWGARDDARYRPAGINRRWRIYRYEPGGEETFAPHVDAGFPPSGLSADGTELVWDAAAPGSAEGEDGGGESREVVSRLTVLMYLNDDFVGGHTKFYAPLSQCEGRSVVDAQDVIASVKPEAGSILVFPQAVGEDAVEHARRHWPLHEGSAVTGGPRAKYVIRSDVLFRTERIHDERERGDPLFRHDDDVRRAFLPKSPAFDSKFLSHVSSLYNPHMGVENAGPLLYALVRFTKVRRVVEIGAGYTSLWLLQALSDNDAEMGEILALQRDGKCRLMDWPWAVPRVVERFCGGADPPSLLCVDNCLHQRETATGAAAVARTLGLDGYLRFRVGDAFDVKFDPESIDLLWCDFGVGSRMKDFASGAWKSIRPGGFLVCHSTLTNRRTRDWLEAARAHEGEDATGIPADEYVEVSFLEPHKHYQNSISVFQRRKGQDGVVYEEPLYSEYA